jgi:hypothetical protein
MRRDPSHPAEDNPAPVEFNSATDDSSISRRVHRAETCDLAFRVEAPEN